jgi:hypothetical protein
MISDPGVVVLVAEDIFSPQECEHVFDALRKSPLYKTVASPESKVVVGVCTISLKPGSSLVDHLKTDQTGGKQLAPDEGMATVTKG